MKDDVSYELRLFAVDFHLCISSSTKVVSPGKTQPRFHIAIDDHNESAVFWGSIP